MHLKTTARAALLLTASLAAANVRAQEAIAAETAPDGTQTLAPVVVTASQVQPTKLPSALPGGQVARGARLGNLGNVDVMTTPFSIKAFTAELIQNQGARSVDELMANDPSARVSLSPGFVLDQSTIRGFQVNSGQYRFDGVPGLFSYNRVTLLNAERAEILKGPSTAVYGGGSAVGGTVNIVPKRATDQPVQSLSLAAGSGSMTEVQADVGRRFGPDNVFGARLNVFAEEGTLANGTHRRNVAPQLALDARFERARVTLDAGTQNFANAGYGLNFTLGAGQTLPAVPDPTHRTLPTFARMSVPNRTWLAGAEVDVTNAVVAYAKHGRLHEKSESISPLTTPLRSDGTFTINNIGFNTWTTDNKVTDAGLRAQFDTAGWKHQFTASALRYESLYAIDTVSKAQTVLPGTPFTPVVANLYTEVPLTNPWAAGLPHLQYAGTPVVQSSWGAADSVTGLNGRLNLVLGWRHQRIQSGAYDGSKASPTVAASWKLADAWTVYGNYATALLQGAQAPAGSKNAGDNLPPYVARQAEGGLKWNAGTYGVTLAAFQIKQASAFLDPADNTFKAGGEQRNRGVELEAFGEVTPGLRLLGGAAYLDAVQTKTRAGATDGKRALGVAKANVNLGTEWDIAAVPSLTATARAIYTGASYVDTINTQIIPAWTRLDAGLRYATTLQGTRLSLRAGVTNLVDRAYWQTGGRNLFVVAEPRTWRVSATAAF